MLSVYKKQFCFYTLNLLILLWQSLQLEAQQKFSGTAGVEKTITVKNGLPVKGNPVYGRNYFTNKFPFAVKDSLVIFFLRRHLNAKTVMLSGSFNNWSPTALAMSRTDSGWIAKINLPYGKHEYKFIIDGIWDIDNDNLLSVSDASGNTNSIFYKTNIFFSVPSFEKAKSIYLAGSFNNWRENELRMLKTPNGWELPLYLDKGIYSYKFIIEDKISGTLIESPYLKTAITTSSSHYGYNLNLNKDISFYERNALARENAGKNKGVVDEMVNMGVKYSNDGDYTKALDYYNKAANLAQQYNLPDLTKIWINISTLYGELFDIPNQLNYLQQAYLNSEKWGDQDGRALVLEKLGHCYMNFFVPKAIVYFREALKEYEQLHHKMATAGVSGSLGYAYFITGDTSKALYYTNRSFLLNQEMNYEIGIATNYWVLGDYYAKSPATQALAINYLHNSLEIFEKHDNKKGLAEVFSIVPKVYLTTTDSVLQKLGIEPSQKWRKAITAEKKSLQLFRQLRDFRQVNVLLLISQTYERSEIYDSALLYFRRYVDFVNETTNVEKQKQIARLEWKYDADKKEEYLSLQKQISDALTKQQRQQLELRNKELLLTKQEKDFQELAYLKSQSDLKNEQLLIQKKEEQLIYAGKEKEFQAAKIKTLTTEKDIAKLNQQRQWIYIAGLFLLIVFAAIYFIYRWRIRSMRLETQLIKEKSEQQQRQSEFQHKLADISLSALRSQMNPHFIFNCLNSIKLYTVQNDTNAATAYLSKFSKLIRLVLENSRSERITLRSELAALELYIQMEAMRFKEKLSYLIDVKENVETEYIELPPLILQPYVENAIWHGLMNREEGGHIDITIEMQNKDSVLEINITDNGVGRKKAAELAKKNAPNHNSYGMKATSERIALINQIYKTGASVIIQDLVDDEGRPAGTQVTIQLPV